jgi:hypothetical protein
MRAVRFECDRRPPAGRSEWRESRLRWLGAPLRVLALVAGLLGPALGSAQGVSVEDNVNRQGADYRNFDLPQPNWDLCRSACAGDGACRAYTYVKPGVQGPNARCWLKDSVPTPVANGCCVSGVKSGSVAPAEGVTFEDNVNRPGGDYRNFDLSQASWEQCRAACAADGACKAYTYVRPGVQGPSARCWLKNSVPGPVAAGGCCISGVKSGGTAPGGHWRLEGQPALRNSYPPSQPPTYDVESFEANARGGQVRVTVFGSGECAPNRGMATPGTSQSFWFRWTLNPDASALRIGDQVAITFLPDGSQNACMQLNPFMAIGGPQRTMPTSDARHRYYTFPAQAQDWHTGGERTVKAIGSHLGPRDEFEIVITGFRVALDLHVRYGYVWVP